MRLSAHAPGAHCAALLASALLLSCRSATDPCTVTSFFISPEVGSLEAGEQLALVATISHTGCGITDLEWESSNSQLATVAPDGTVTGVAEGGPLLVTAAFRGYSAAAAIIVERPSIANLSVSVADNLIDVGDNTLVQTAITNSRGGSLAGRQLNWSSSAPDVASVDNTGRIFAIKTGAATVTARDPDNAAKTASLIATVVPANSVASMSLTAAPGSMPVGLRKTLILVLRNKSGAVITGRDVAWTSSNLAVATLPPGSEWTDCALEGQTCAFAGMKLVRFGLAEGVHRVATAGTQCTTAAFGIDPAPNSSKTCSYSDMPHFVDGTVLTTAVGLGSATITATPVENPRNVSVQLALNTTMTGAFVRRVRFTNAPEQIQTGQSINLTTLTVDTAGQFIRIAPSFESKNPALASLTPAGVLTGIAQGIVEIATRPGAGVDGRGDSTQVTVTGLLAPVNNVTVALNAANLQVGQQTQANATLSDAQANILNGRVIVWSSSNAAAANVNQNGVVTALAQGNTNITATSEGVSGFANLIVLPPGPAPVASVTVTVNNANPLVGQQTQASATLRDAQGNVLLGRAIVWSTNNAPVANVAQNGLVSTFAAGNANITATSEGVSGFVAITVAAGGVASANRLGYALVNGATSTLDPDFTANIGGGNVTVTSLGVGHWRVTFQGLAATAGQSDVAFVTPGETAHCVVDNWAAAVADVNVVVRCTTIGAGFAPTNNTRFSVVLVGNTVFQARSAFTFANQPNSLAYPGPAANSYSSAGGVLQLQDDAPNNGLGAYTAFLGVFPRGAAGPEIPLMSTVAAGGTTTHCESEGADVFLGAGAHYAQCRTPGGAGVRAMYSLLVFEKGRNGKQWGFGYFDKTGQTIVSQFAAQSTGTAVSFTQMAGNVVRLNLSPVAAGGKRGLAVMPNFNGMFWVSCGFRTLTPAAGQYEVVCRNSTGTVVASDFTILIVE